MPPLSMLKPSVALMLVASTTAVGAAADIVGLGGEFRPASPGNAAPFGEFFFEPVLDIDGDTAVVGASGEQVGDAELAGAVYVYTRSAGGWRFEQRLVASVVRERAAFGASVDVDGNRLVVGAPEHRDASGTTITGGAFVFERSPEGWAEVKSILPPAPAQHVGLRVALAGDFAALLGETSCSDGCGTLRVLRRGPGGWSDPVSVFRPGPYGWSTALDLAADGTLAVGADGAAPGARHVVAYVMAIGAMDVQLRATIDVPSATNGGSISPILDLALSPAGDALAIGAPMRLAAGGQTRGVVFIRRRVVDAWIGDGEVVDSPAAGAPSSDFGATLAFDGTRLAVTARNVAPSPFPTNLHPVIVHAFAREGAQWRSRGRVVSSETARITGPIALSADGMLSGTDHGDSSYHDRRVVAIRETSFGAPFSPRGLIVNAPRETGRQGGSALATSGPYVLVGSPGAIAQGVVRAYPSSPMGSGPVATLAAPDGHAADGFGTSIATSGDFVLVGAPLQRVDGVPTRGAAHLFRRTGTAFVHVRRIIDDGGEMNDVFGTAVALTATHAVVSAPSRRDGASPGAGSIFLYARNDAALTLLDRLDDPVPGVSTRMGEVLAMRDDELATSVTFIEGAPPDRLMTYRITTGAFVPFATLESVGNSGFPAAATYAGDLLYVGATGTALVHRFRRDGGAYVPLPPVSDPDGPIDHSNFGSSLYVDAAQLVVGATRASINLPGRAFRFVDPAGTPTLVQRYVSPRSRPTDVFGAAVLAHDGLVIIGAPFAWETDPARAPDTGTTFVFGDFVLVNGFE